MDANQFAAERHAFETAAFAQRVLASIVQAGGILPGIKSMSKGCPDLAVFTARGPYGHYLDSILDVMWWAWQARARLEEPQ